MKLSKIKITPEFAATTPKYKKMWLCNYCYERTGKLDREIVVNEDGELIDGYVGYLILKENGIKRTRVTRTHNTLETFLYVYRKSKRREILTLLNKTKNQKMEEIKRV